MIDYLDNFWSIYSNLVLSLGTASLLALSIYLTLSCGMLAMANAAFMGIGAYTSAILTMNYNAPFAVAIAAGMVAPAIVAFLIGKPTLRLSGVYLAMATLAFGEVVRIVILNTDNLTGGALGLNGIPQLTQWWHVLAAVAVVLFCLARLRRSKIGRAFEKKFQQPLTLNSALGYFGTMVAIRALDAAKSFKSEDIADALRKVKVAKEEMITSSDYLEFDENGRNKGRDTTVTQFQGDRLVTVWPPEKATAKPVLKGFNTP